MFGIYQNGFLFIKIFQDGILWFSHFTLQFYMTVSTRKKKIKKKSSTKLLLLEQKTKKNYLNWLKKYANLYIICIVWFDIFRCVHVCGGARTHNDVIVSEYTRTSGENDERTN